MPKLKANRIINNTSNNLHNSTAINDGNNTKYKYSTYPFSKNGYNPKCQHDFTAQSVASKQFCKYCNVFRYRVVVFQKNTNDRFTSLEERQLLVQME